MNTHELCCVGHITLDKVVTPKNTVHMLLLFLACDKTFR